MVAGMKNQNWCAGMQSKKEGREKDENYIKVGVKRKKKSQVKKFKLR